MKKLLLILLLFATPLCAIENPSYILDNAQLSAFIFPVSGGSVAPTAPAATSQVDWFADDEATAGQGDNVTQILDSSGNGNTQKQATGAKQFTFETAFNGEKAYKSAGDWTTANASADFDISGTMAITINVYITDVDNTQYIISNGDGSTNGYSIFYSGTQDDIYFATSGNITMQSNSNLSANQWVVITLRFNETSSTMDMRFDGQVVDEEAYTTPISSNGANCLSTKAWDLGAFPLNSGYINRIIYGE